MGGGLTVADWLACATIVTHFLSRVDGSKKSVSVSDPDGSTVIIAAVKMTLYNY